MSNRINFPKNMNTSPIEILDKILKKLTSKEVDNFLLLLALIFLISV